MANSPAAQAEERSCAQTAPCPSAQETPSLLARGLLPDELSTPPADPSATAAGRADDSRRRTSHRLPAESGVCNAAQQTSGGGTGLLARASQSVPCGRTHQFCERDSSRLCRCSRRLLFRVE